MDYLTVICVFLYLAVTAYLGFLGYRSTKSASDYLLAGRAANPVIMALSYGSTFISTSAIVGFGGVAANFGMSILWLTVLNIIAGIFIAFIVLGGPTRRIGHHLGAHTFPEFLAKRYDCPFLQRFAALLIFVFMPLYAMAVMVGGAQFISAGFNIDKNVSLFIFALIVAAYVIPGGLKGVMLTDALQGTIMLIGMLILIVSAYGALGGVIPAHQELTSLADKAPPGLKAIGHQGWTSMPKFGWSDVGMPAAGESRPADQFDLWWTLVTTLVMGVGIGVLAQPQLVVRFMTVSSQKSLNRAVPIGGFFIIAMTGVAFVVGSLSNAYFVNHEAISCTVIDEAVLMTPDANGNLELLPTTATEEQKTAAKRFVSYRLPGEAADKAPHYVMNTPSMSIERGAGKGGSDIFKPGLVAIARSVTLGTPLKGSMDRIIPEYIVSAMPKWFGILFLLTLLAAAMSTLSSQFHTIGSSFGHDLLQSISKQGGMKAVFATRVGVLVGLIMSISIGWLAGGNVIAAATAVFFGVCAVSFIPAFVLGLFWKRMNKQGAVASVLTGFATGAFWLSFIHEKNAAAFGLCKALFGRTSLVPEGWSVTWTVVDPLIIGLPISLAIAVIVSLATKPLPANYVAYVFGGQKPTGR